MGDSETPAERRESSALSTSTDESAPNTSSRRVDRRTALTCVGSVGYALGVGHYLGIDSALDPPDGTVEIETAYVRSDDGQLFGEPGSRTTLEPITRTVPADWYHRVETALDVHATLVRTQLPGYLNSAVVPGSYESGTVTLSIGVESDDLWSLPGDVASVLSRIGIEWDGTLEGIEIDIEDEDSIDELERDASPEPTQLVRNANVDPVPGGVRCAVSSSYATLTPAVYRSGEAEPLFATALHAFPGWDDSVGETLSLPTLVDRRPLTIGHVVDTLPDVDVAIARPVSAIRPGSVVGRTNGIPIAGQFTRWGLADLVARGESVAKIGGTSGRTTGDVHGIDAATCVTTDRCQGGQLKWGTEADISDGDSGSVTIYPDHDEVDGAIVASVNSARTWWPGQDHVWGVSAHTLTERHGYHF
ncbi:hypothetical protein [Halovivax gelatinilyticus]|uniref:hypothetical protein n=1 Tax=Halovivax gelatinilyticus TaxID=2961597 RepID=UPI0020CA6C7F|nr:hypothetical protein [Halovivax gelatinilyticus]